MTACLLYAKIHKNKAENLLHLMLYFSFVKYKLKIIDISVTKEYDGVSREAGAFPSKCKGGSSMV